MRVTQSETYRNFSSDLENLNDLYNQISRQVSSGKKLTQLGDAPGDCAELLSMTDLSVDIDQYRSSTDTVSYYLTVADSALNEVGNLVTSVYAKGSQASTETLGEAERQTLAVDIRSLRDQILTLANSEAGGRSLFAGSSVSSAAFTISGDTVVYAGNSDTNTIRVDSGLEIQSGVAGSEAFGSVFASIEALLTAVDSNDISGMGSALGQFATAISDLGKARGKIGAGLNQVENLQTRMDDRETTLKQQRSKLEDADAAQSIIDLSQAKTGLQASISAGGSMLSQRNLFDILG